MRMREVPILGLTFLGMLFSGCSKAEIPNETMDVSAASDPMEKTNTPAVSSSKSTSYGFSFKVENIAAENGELILTPTLMGSEESTSAGLLVFIDGILQEYGVSDSPEKAYISTFDTVPNGEETLELHVDAVIDKALDEHYVCVCSMLCPDFRPSANNPNFGFYHRIMNVMPLKLDVKDINCSTAEPKAFRAENSVLTAAQKERYSNGEDENGDPIIYGFELTQTDGGSSDTYVIHEGEAPLSLSFAACTSEPYVVDYRVTFYKNHTPCKFNGDYDCLDITMEGGKIVEEEIILDGLEAGDVVYCIAIPTNDTVAGVAEKSSSRLVMAEGSGLPPEETENGAAEKTAYNIAAQNSKPIFTIDDTAYFINSKNYSPENQSGIFLCSSKDGANIDKTLEIGTSVPKAHGEYISVILEKNGEVFAKIYDKNFSEIKSAKINGILNADFQLEIDCAYIDFDIDKILYVSEFNKLCLCDWDLENKKTLMTLPRDEEPSARNFTAAALSGEFAAFSANGKDNGQDLDFYGVCDFEGNYEIRRKDGVSSPQTNDSRAVWSDCHVALDELPSGEIEIYENGDFGALKTVEQTESQFAFLSGNGVLTFAENCNIIRKYEGGTITEIPLERGEYGVAAVAFNGKILAESYGGDGKNKTYAIEVG